MPLPDSIRRTLDPLVASVLDAQWDAQLARNLVIGEMQNTISHLREQVRLSDPPPKNDSPLVTLSPARSNMSCLSDQSDESDHSVEPRCLRDLLEDIPSPPFIQALPTRDGYTSFHWDVPPLCWPAPVKDIFFKVKESTPLRRLWHQNASVNNFICWLDVTPADVLAFWKDSLQLLSSLRSHNSPATVLGKIGGGLEDFLTGEVGVQFCLGVSPLTTLPGAGFLPITPLCTAFGGTPLKLEDILKPGNSPLTILLRPEGLSKQSLSLVLEKIDMVLTFPDTSNSRPFRVVALYSRADCRMFNAWVDKWERSNRSHAMCGVSHLTTKNMAEAKGPISSAPGPWEILIVDGGLAPPLDDLVMPELRRCLWKRTPDGW